MGKLRLPSERATRLAAGLIMFSYATCHLLSHATGLFLLDAIQAVGHDIILAPWRTPPGLVLLLFAFLTHLGLGLKALYRRRHLRMPPIEAWQLGLGLVTPLLIAPHVTDARLGVLLYGLEDSYFRVLYVFWVADPAVSLSRQLALLVAVWIHGCIGIYMWLRSRSWFVRRLRWFTGAAIALPTLAILGVINAGWDTILRNAVTPGFAAAHAPGPEAAAAVAVLSLRLQLVYIAIVGGVLVLRAIRNAYERRLTGITIDYRAMRQVTVPRGFSLLEASRWAAIPHTSVCGGRARCTTCRVRIWHGLDGLAPAAPIEQNALKWIRAPHDVRLACQVRPETDITITPLVPISRLRDGLRLDLSEARERNVTALHADLRDSVRLAAGRLPYDALFIVDRYIQATTSAILSNGGHITSVAGDGIMSVFGVDCDAATAARQALSAAEALWRGIDRISDDLADDIGSRLRFGIGIHSGLAVIGTLGSPNQQSLQFLGDTGNIAARLQSLSRDMNCTLVLSAETAATAGREDARWRHATVDIRGADSVMPVFLIDACEGLVDSGLAVPAP